MDMERFMEAHAAGLMFPYIREHIATVTQKAGVKPVLLPPVNIFAIMDKMEESLTDTVEISIPNPSK